MRVLGWTLVLLGVALLAGAIGLWWAQNAHQTAQMQFDLGSGVGAAWRMQDAQPVPLLMLLSFVSGLLLAGLPLLVRVSSLKRRVRRLEAMSAMSREIT